MVQTNKIPSKSIGYKGHTNRTCPRTGETLERRMCAEAGSVKNYCLHPTVVFVFIVFIKRSQSVSKAFLIRFLVDLNPVALVHLLLGETVHHRRYEISAIKDKLGQFRGVLYNQD